MITGAAIGALTGAVDAVGAKVAGLGSETKNLGADKKSKKAISETASDTNKKTKSGK